MDSFTLSNLHLRQVTQGSISNADAVIEQLRVDTARTIRQSGVILASFNAVGGLALAAGIFWDCYRSAKRADPKMKFRDSAYNIIGSLNVFPFVLAIGITIQGIITAIEQSKGLDALLILGCRHISQVMLPTIFIVPIIQLIFGMETTVRAFRRKAFEGFGKWTVSICIALVFVSLIVIYTVGQVVQPPNFCFASLFWLVQKWRTFCFALFTIISCTLLLGSAIVISRLLRGASGGAIERICASRMVYYMCSGVITNVLVVPFFASLTVHNDLEVTKDRENLSMAAMVASNLTALINGAMYIFLRTCQGSNIGRRDYFEVEHKKQHQDTKGHEMDDSPFTEMFAKQIEVPVSPPSRAYQPNTPSTAHGRKRSQSGSTTSPSSPPRKTHSRKASYTLFPPQQPTSQSQPQPQSQSQSQQKSQTPILAAEPLSSLPAAIYTPPTIARNSHGQADDDDVFDVQIALIRDDATSLLPLTKTPAPTMGKKWSSFRGSSATVQIGLRLSNVNDMPNAAVAAAVAATPQVQERGFVPRPTSSIYPQSMLPPQKTMPVPQHIGAVARRADDAMDKNLSPWPLQVTKNKKQVSGGEKDSAGGEDSRQILLSPAVYTPDSASRSEAKTETTSASDTEPPLSPWLLKAVGLGNSTSENGTESASARESQQIRLSPTVYSPDSASTSRTGLAVSSKSDTETQPTSGGSTPKKQPSEWI